MFWGFLLLFFWFERESYEHVPFLVHLLWEGDFQVDWNPGLLWSFTQNVTRGAFLFVVKALVLVCFFVHPQPDIFLLLCGDYCLVTQRSHKSSVVYAWHEMWFHLPDSGASLIVHWMTFHQTKDTLLNESPLNTISKWMKNERNTTSLILLILEKNFIDCHHCIKENVQKHACER